MGQKVSPIGFRTGITIGWKSRWFAPKSNFGEFLVEDAKIRKFVDAKLNRQPPYAAISEIQIERTREEVKVFLKTARPGLVIGPKGAEVDKLRGALEDLTDRRVSINIIEIKNPDLDAQLVAEGIAEQLKRRSSFRRAMKQRAEATMQAGAKGVKVVISGRLGGAEMSRTEKMIMGSLPLQTLEADVDYGFTPCNTTYGVIGVKVWIYRGKFGEVLEIPPPQPGRPPRRREGGFGFGPPGGGGGGQGGPGGGRGRPGGGGGGGRMGGGGPGGPRRPGRGGPRPESQPPAGGAAPPEPAAPEAPTGEPKT
jgi:small subunit ribosomal protein S3